VAKARRFIHAPPEDIFNVLSKPETYERWVVGCQAVRDHDQAWPEPGASFEHRIGIGPLRVQDITTVVAATPPRRLVLRTRAWPLGETTVELRLVAARDGTQVEMRQHPSAGPIAKLDNPLQQFWTGLRDRECLRRLAQLAERGLQEAPS
jgi:uncharacterized protein YndB with AHSA1/START domain